ncbi:MAG: SpoIIE family protein phosphatase [Clostridia bacterium]|nr:SpoIIE family protein phosphatase [Clostridia bacterium]
MIEAKTAPLSIRDILRALVSFAAFVMLRLNSLGYGILFAFALYAVIVIYCEIPYFYAIAFVLSALVKESGLLLSAGMALPLLIFKSIIHIKRFNPRILFFYLIEGLSLCLYIGIGLTSVDILLERLLGVAICAVFTLICSLSIKVYNKRKKRFRIPVEQSIAVCLFFFCLMRGVCAITLWGFSLIRFTAPVVILCATYIFGGQGGLICAVIAGAGCITEFGLNYISVFCLWALIVLPFMRINRYIAALALIVSDALLLLITQADVTVQNVTACVLGSLCFMVIPTSLLNSLKNRYKKQEQYSSRHIINRLRNNTADKLFKLSEIFFSMELSFKSMVKGVLPVERAQHELLKEVDEQVCISCPERMKCQRLHAEDTQDSLLSLIQTALSRGKATILDVDGYLSSRCGRLNAVIACINHQAANYKHYHEMTTTADNSKLLIGEQLGGVSKLLQSLSKESKCALSFDGKKERHLIEELGIRNILVKEAVCYGENGNMNLTLVIDINDSNHPQLMDIVSDVLQAPYMIDKAEYTDNNEWRVLHIKPQPRFDVLFGFQAVKKYQSNVSGDSHSFLKIANDKFMLAICDGMGSGEKAERVSNRAISLVENFYKAGFDNEIILNCVNKLLVVNNDETFSAMDICIINLANGLCDLIKIGAPSSIIRINGEYDVVEGGSLPLGVLENISPSISKTALNVNDLIVLFSDGLLEAFNRNSLLRFVSCQPEHDPQALANAIIKQALNLTPQPNDDITVIVAKIC